MPATGAWLGRSEERALLALLDALNSQEHLFVGRLVSSSSKSWLPFSQVHQLVLIVLQALKMVRLLGHLSVAVEQQSGSSGNNKPAAQEQYTVKKKFVT